MNSATLLVSNLSSTVSSKDLQSLFERYGPIIENTRLDDNTAIIQYEDYRDAQDALVELNRRTLYGEIIEVEYYQEPHNSDILSNDEIMNVWLDERNRDNDDNVVIMPHVGQIEQIPLSFVDFLDWFKTNQQKTTFIFPTRLVTGGGIILRIKDQYIYLAVRKRALKKTIYNQDIPIDTDTDILRKWDMGIGKNLEESISVFFNSKLKRQYTHARLIFKSNVHKWENILQQFFPNANMPEIYFHMGVMPKGKVPNGTKIDTKVTLNYNNMPVGDRKLLIVEPTNYENKIKLKLNQENHFGDYNINVLFVVLEDVHIKFKTSEVNAKITIVGELINPDDYYGTIGAYRLIWENICIKNKFNKKGLIELAENLQLNYKDGDDLCEIVGEKVNNLSWDDFRES